MRGRAVPFCCVCPTDISRPHKRRVALGVAEGSCGAGVLRVLRWGCEHRAPQISAGRSGAQQLRALPLWEGGVGVSHLRAGRSGTDALNVGSGRWRGWKPSERRRRAALCSQSPTQQRAGSRLLSKVETLPPSPPPFRLEEQTKKLQKDMKKSTDADLGTLGAAPWGGGRRGLRGALPHRRRSAPLRFAYGAVHTWAVSRGRAVLRGHMKCSVLCVGEGKSGAEHRAHRGLPWRAVCATRPQKQKQKQKQSSHRGLHWPWGGRRAPRGCWVSSSLSIALPGAQRWALFARSVRSPPGAVGGLCFLRAAPRRSGRCAPADRGLNRH